MPPKSKEKVLNVFSVENLTNATTKKELSIKLEELHKALGELSQDPSERPSSLKELAATLISSRIASNNDREVRLLAGCCMVDILRVCAPDAPLSDKDMIIAFELIVKLLHGLSTYNTTSEAGSNVLYILRSLSTIKSCVVPVMLAQSNVKGADDLVMNMFETLISSIRQDHEDESK